MNICLNDMYAKNVSESQVLESFTLKKLFGSQPNVQVRSDTEPEPPFRFRFDDLTEPNLEH